MSNFNTLLGGDAAATRMIQDSRSADALFPDATWYQVGTDQALTKFLFDSIDPSDRLKGDISKLQKKLIEDVETRRGGALWLAAIGGPREYPSSIYQHQSFNLQERLYLSSPSGYGKNPYYGTDLQSVEKKENKVAISAAAGGGLALLIGSIIWIARRRDIISPKN